MKRIAILGASSQIAKDLILSYGAGAQLLLYGRDPEATRRWLAQHGLSHPAFSYAQYGQEDHEAVINFVGVGDPQRAMQMGAAIFDLTLEYDNLVLEQLVLHPQRRYIFLSSGAVYGSTFLEPAGPQTKAMISINDFRPEEYYSVAKMYAECKHRTLSRFAITDVRIFNYFSRSQDLNARFFITDILRAISTMQIFRASSDFMMRDYLHPLDFHQLIECILNAPPTNTPIDCYSRAPVDKLGLLNAMQQHFDLQYALTVAPPAVVNATGVKPYYYSLNRQAADIGYQPGHSSLDCIIAESRAILSGTGGLNGLSGISGNTPAHTAAHTNEQPQ